MYWGSDVFQENIPCTNTLPWPPSSMVPFSTSQHSSIDVIVAADVKFCASLFFTTVLGAQHSLWLIWDKWCTVRGHSARQYWMWVVYGPSIYLDNPQAVFLHRVFMQGSECQQFWQFHLLSWHVQSGLTSQISNVCQYLEILSMAKNWKGNLTDVVVDQPQTCSCGKERLSLAITNYSK